MEVVKQAMELLLFRISKRNERKGRRRQRIAFVVANKKYAYSATMKAAARRLKFVL